jgi:hypothetical protein
MSRALSNDLVEEATTLWLGVYVNQAKPVKIWVTLQSQSIFAVTGKRHGKTVPILGRSDRSDLEVEIVLIVAYIIECFANTGRSLC